MNFWNLTKLPTQIKTYPIKKKKIAGSLISELERLYSNIILLSINYCYVYALKIFYNIPTIWEILAVNIEITSQNIALRIMIKIELRKLKSF